MKITKNKVATFDYELFDEQGTLLDSSAEEPLAYIHGVGQIVPGLERALEGKAEGEAVSVVVPPDEGYGDRDEELILTVSRAQFERPTDVVVGLQVHVNGPDGDSVARVTAIAGDEVTLDANHPLAGKTLSFSVTIRGVRDATKEELRHGHVHGEGGHHHH
jgi:FKBP-type peptidyl-prolyl cis-trans isomerase SlyD